MIELTLKFSDAEQAIAFLTPLTAPAADKGEGVDASTAVVPPKRRGRPPKPVPAPYVPPPGPSLATQISLPLPLPAPSPVEAPIAVAATASAPPAAEPPAAATRASVRDAAQRVLEKLGAGPGMTAARKVIVDCAKVMRIDDIPLDKCDVVTKGLLELLP